MSEKSKDFTIAGPGSPISLKKVIEEFLSDDGIDHDGTPIAEKRIKVLLDQSHSGFYTEDAPAQSIKFEDALLNAMYYKDNFFNGKQVSFYILRHLIFFYWNEHRKLVYPHDKASPSALEKFLTSEEGKPIYAEILNKIKFLEYNKEWQHLLGMIICINGCLKIAKQQKCGVRLYIEHPEAHMHPKQEALFMSFLEEVYDEYKDRPMSDSMLAKIVN